MKYSFPNRNSTSDTTSFDLLPYNPNPVTALIQCTLTMTIPIVERAGAFTTRRAIVATEGTFTYGNLLAASKRVASELLDGAAMTLNGARVSCFSCPVRLPVRRRPVGNLAGGRRSCAAGPFRDRARDSVQDRRHRSHRPDRPSRLRRRAPSVRRRRPAHASSPRPSCSEATAQPTCRKSTPNVPL